MFSKELITRLKIEKDKVLGIKHEMPLKVFRVL